MPDPMLSDARAIVEHVDPTDGFDAGLSVDFIAEHGPALLARLEGCEAADNPSADALDKLWEHVITKRKPDYGTWEYPGFAFRHLAAEFDELRAQYEAAIRGLRAAARAHTTEHEWDAITAVLSHPLAKEVAP